MGRGMFWVRANRRIGAAVALFALALQLVLSFGHVHPNKSALLAPVAAIAATAADGGTSPDHQRRSGTDDFCAICATISLAGNLLLPEASAVAAPIADTSAWPPETRAAPVSGEPHHPFQARAPPCASLLG